MRAAMRSVAHVATKLYSVPYAAPSQHRGQLLLAPGTQLRQFSATANKMSVPWTSVPAQGGVAQAAVKAEGKADALEAEEVVLQEQIASLEEQIVTIETALTTELRKTAESAEEVSNAVQYDMVLANESRLATAMRAKLAKAKSNLAKLEENLKYVRGELLEVRKQQTLAMEQERMAQEETSEAKEERLNELAERFEFKFRVNETQERPVYRGAEEAKAAVMPYIRGALRIGTADEKVAWNNSNGKNLAYIFATIGQMGKGKTRLQYELCRQSAGRISEEPVKMDFGATHVNFVRLAYNEGFQSDAFSGVTTTIFGRNLLMCNGMSSEDAGRVQSLDEAVELLYRKLTWPTGKAQALVVCVDEFLSLLTGQVTHAATARGELMRELVVFQEKSCKGQQRNRVVFLFAAVTEEMIAAAAQSSGRQMCTRGVPTLGEDAALDMLFTIRPDLKARYKTDTQFEQLVHLCLPRPRALFVGLLDAYPVWKEGQEVSMTDALREVARSNSVNEALRFRYLEEEEVQSWLTSMSLSSTPERKELQKQWGVTAADGSLDPLTLRYWCEVWSNVEWKDLPGKTKEILPVARYLRMAYLADTKVTEKHPKVVEEVLYNFEAAKRVSHNGPFNLSEYYRGGTIKGGLGEARVCAFPGDLQRPDDLVKTVANFRGKTDVSALLRKGCVVSSENVTEVGIEYLVPFFHPKWRTLYYVAAVQVKYSPRHKKGKDYDDICVNVMKLPIIKHLMDEEKVTCFPVVFSTVYGVMPEDADKDEHGVLTSADKDEHGVLTSDDKDEHGVLTSADKDEHGVLTSDDKVKRGVLTSADKVERGVLFNEAAMIKFTGCLGPLRYHREKASATQITKIREHSVGPDPAQPKATPKRTKKRKERA